MDWVYSVWKLKYIYQKWHDFEVLMVNLVYVVWRLLYIYFFELILAVLEVGKVYIWTSSHYIYLNSGICAIFSQKRFWIEIFVACIYLVAFSGEQRKSSTAVSMPILNRMIGFLGLGWCGFMLGWWNFLCWSDVVLRWCERIWWN